MINSAIKKHQLESLNCYNFVFRWLRSASQSTCLVVLCSSRYPARWGLFWLFTRSIVVYLEGPSLRASSLPVCTKPTSFIWVLAYVAHVGGVRSVHGRGMQRTWEGYASSFPASLTVPRVGNVTSQNCYILIDIGDELSSYLCSVLGH